MLAALVWSDASSAEITFNGRVLRSDAKPFRDVQVWLQRDTGFQYRIDNKNFFETRTDSNGRFSFTVSASGGYSLCVTRIERVDDLIISDIQARAGDVWQFDYNIDRRVATLRGKNAKIVRRFEYLGSHTKLLAGGNWRETTNGIPKWERECAELQAHPTIVSETGVVLCAKHRIPLVTRRGYEPSKHPNEITLSHTAGLQAKKLECNPNYIPLDVSFKRDKQHTVPTTVTYCPKCEDASWLTDGEFRREAGSDAPKVERHPVQR